MYTAFSIKDDILIVKLSGEIDHHVAEKIRTDIDEEVKIYKCRHIIFDFCNVNFMDSSGVGIVLGRYKKMNQIGGTVKIKNANKIVKQILDMSGVFSLMECEGGNDGK